MAQPESAPEEVSPPKIDRGWCCRFLSEGPAWELNSQHGLESSVYFENPGHQVSAGQLVLFFAPSRELIGSGDVTSAAAPNNVLPSTSENPVSGVKFRQDIVVGKVTLLPVPTPGFEDFLSDRSVLGSGTIQEIGFEWVELSKMESTSARLRLSRQQGINAARFAKTPVITYEDPTAPLSASTKETLAVAAQIALDANALC